MSCAQLFGHEPQSLGQFEQVSPASHNPLGQLGAHAPQSLGHVMQVSPGSHSPLGQVGGHAPQSPGQVEQVSGAWQMASPQTTLPPVELLVADEVSLDDVSPLLAPV